MKIITQHQLKRILGTADVAKQCAVLRNAGIVPIIRESDGRLVVFEETLLAAQTGITASIEPDWSALNA